MKWGMHCPGGSGSGGMQGRSGLLPPAAQKLNKNRQVIHICPADYPVCRRSRDWKQMEARRPGQTR